MSVTIRDVAERAGTSTATVSKVMNGSYSISEATASRVRQAMEELDYHPNSMARSFARQATKTIVFAADIGKNSGFAQPQLFEIVCGLEQALKPRGYSLVIKSVSPAETVEYARQSIDTKLCDGIVLHASVLSEELDALSYERQLPHLVIGTPDVGSHFCWIDIDNRLAGEMAAQHLLEQGYRSVAFIGGREKDRISAHRLDGVRVVLEKHDLYLPKNHLKTGESMPESGYELTKELLQTLRRPDAVICADNYIAYGCMEALKEAGLSVPQEMGVVTFDDYPFSRVLKPKLSVVGIDVFDVGEQAGRYMIQKIKKPNFYVQSYITIPTLIARESTARVR